MYVYAYTCIYYMYAYICKYMNIIVYMCTFNMHVIVYMCAYMYTFNIYIYNILTGSKYKILEII